MGILIEQSPLSPFEKRYLKGFTFSPDYWSFIWVASVVFGFWLAILFFPSYVIWHWLKLVEYPSNFRHLFLNVSMALSALLTIWAMRSEIRHFFKPPRSDSPVAADLAGGVADVQLLSVKRALEIEEYDDEGAGFLLELEEGGVLCLISQNYYEYVTDIELEEGEPDLRSDFPHTIIEYRYGPNSGLPLNAVGIGQTLRPTLKIPRCPKTRKDKKTRRHIYCAPEDGTFYPGTLEDVCRQFDYRPVPI